MQTRRPRGRGPMGQCKCLLAKGRGEGKEAAAAKGATSREGGKVVSFSFRFKGGLEEAEGSSGQAESARLVCALD
eukprot:3260306-Pleurochrysis_carterae.AAC.2